MPVNNLRGKDSSSSDNVSTDNLSTGLDSPEKVPTLIFVGVLCNPLLQKGAGMVAATMCSHSQLEDRMEHLHTYVKEYHEKLEVDTVTMVANGKDVRTHKY